MSFDSEWVRAAEQSAQSFAAAHGTTYNFNWDNLWAAFEVGCFHVVVDFYRGPYHIALQNLTAAGEYKYLTTPNGNPDNFSFVRLNGPNGSFDLRQQVRVQSAMDERISFTPDLVIVPSESAIGTGTHETYARGNRRFFFVSSNDVVSAHECKSTPPFPELLVSYLGMVLLAHRWFNPASPLERISDHGEHLAPTLFVGGAGTPWNYRMVDALESHFPVNIFLNLHATRFARFSRVCKRISLRGDA